MDDKPVMLIVDDVEINRVVLTQFFQEEYQIIEAENGQEAMTVIEQQPVSIVLVDLVMPIMDGFQMLSMMKRNDQFAGIPVVVMTANNDGDSEARAMEMGAADFITKPYNPTIVRCRIRNVMAREEIEWRRVAQVAQNRQLMEMHQYAEKDAGFITGRRFTGNLLSLCRNTIRRAIALCIWTSAVLRSSMICSALRREILY